MELGNLKKWGTMMKLIMENIGKVSHASIDINGITVVAGENNLGKSTISKALYSVVDGLSNYEDEIIAQRLQLVFQKIKESMRGIRIRRYSLFECIDAIEFKIGEELKINTNPRGRRIGKNRELVTVQDMSEVVKKFEEGGELDEDDIELIFEKILNLLDESRKIYISDDEISFENIDIPELLDNVNEIMSAPKNKILMRLLSNHFNKEFQNQVNNIYDKNLKAKVGLIVKDKSVNIDITENKVTKISDNPENLWVNVEYIDNPFILDDIPSRMIERNRYSLYHGTKLIYDLQKGISDNAIEGYILDEKFQEIEDELLKIVKGNLKSADMHVGLSENDSDQIIDIKNVSAGLKIFIIIKTLFENKSLEENGILILDEPEIHLHPDWQVKLAKIIVLIQKIFKMHILLNTHSPYFINAIEVYSDLYNIENNFYLAEQTDKGTMFVNVNKNVDKIYKKMLKPFQDLENIDERER